MPSSLRCTNPFGGRREESECIYLGIIISVEFFEGHQVFVGVDTLYRRRERGVV